MKLTKLKEVRTDRGYTLAEVGEFGGVSGKTIHTYERGGRVLMRVAKKIAAGLGVTVEALQGLPANDSLTAR